MNIHSTAIKKDILCFTCDIQMEYVLPEEIEEGYIRLRCPNCGMVYLVPNKKFSEGNIILKAEYSLKVEEKEKVIAE